jgi:hypothetical protein
MRATPTTGGAEYVTLQKYFLTSKFRYLRLFRNPTHQTENGTANMWELLIANQLDQSLCLANRK